MIGKNNIGSLPPFREVIETENAYQESLQIFVTALQEIKAPESVPEILNNIKKFSAGFSEVSARLANNLQHTINAHQENNALFLTQLRKERIAIINQFYELYGNYSKLYSEYLECKQKNSTQFKAINDIIKKRTNRQKSPEDCLISPIQRGPQYLLLLRELKKYNQNFDIDTKSHLTDLEEKLNEKLNEVNAQLRKNSVSHIIGVSLQILGGFSAVLGAAAVAAGVVLLIASCGTAALITVGIGAAVLAGGLGFFAAGSFAKPTPASSMAGIKP